jgi:hypothetical protein
MTFVIFARVFSPLALRMTKTGSPRRAVPPRILPTAMRPT